MKRPTKTHLICYVLDQVNIPMTREDILRRVYILQPGKVNFRATSNKSYFDPCNGPHRSWGMPGHRCMDISLVVKKLIKKSGRNSKRFMLYALTPKGKKLADEYFAWAQ